LKNHAKIHGSAEGRDNSRWQTSEQGKGGKLLHGILMSSTQIDPRLANAIYITGLTNAIYITE